ncbi:MAG: aminomethyltransferase family protein [Rhodobacteraceae bacterium]|nr:aminomethyltransferase family protein [Paracoccaceae bacterium]
MSAAKNLRQPMAMGVVPGPFHDRIAPLNHRQGWMNWMGIAAPTVLDTVEFEYFAIRNQATVFDISPMMKYRISGPDAETVVNRLVTRDIRKVGPGRVTYAIWCDEDGNVVDDGTIFRFADGTFRLCCQEPQMAWLMDVAHGFDVSLADESADVAGLAVQGPTSCAVLKDMGLAGVEAMKPFDIREFRVKSKPVTVSRTGFTGDLGYELWMAPDDALTIWDHLMAAGHLRGVKVIGYEALEMARIEAGFLLPRVDFVSSQTHLRPGRARNPYELGLDRLVHLDKPHFNGRRALQRLSQTRPARKLVTLEISRDKPAHHAYVYHRGKKEVGFVTSALWSPTLKRNIAYAWVDAPYCFDGKDLSVEIYLQRELVWQRRMARAQIVDRGLFANPRRTATPPSDY